MEINEAYGADIKSMLKKRGMTQKDLAGDLNVTPQSVSNWVRGKNRPDEDIRSVLGDRYGVFLKNPHGHNEAWGNEEMKLIKLSEIKTMEEMNGAIDYLLDSIPFDLAYQNTLRSCSAIVLRIVIGCYKGIEYLDNLDDKSKFELDLTSGPLDDYPLIATPNDDWFAVSYMIRQILDSFISLNIDDQFDGDTLLDEELYLLHEDFVDPLLEIYTKHNGCNEDDLTYRLLRLAYDSWLHDWRIIFLNGIKEPSSAALCLRTSLLTLSDFIAGEYGKILRSESAR